VGAKKEEFLTKLQLAAMLSLSIATMAASGVLLFNQFVVELIAGKDFYAGTHATVWFALATILVPMSAVYACLLQISGKMGKTPLVSILSLAGSYIAAIFAYQWIGLAGLAAVFALEPLIYGLYGFFRGAKDLGYMLSEFPIKAMVVTLLSCLLVGISGSAMNFLPAGTCEIHLWQRSATLPGIYQWAIALIIVMTASGFAIYSIRQKRN
jgi:O-antigen/teichoic acid export membrane protein